MISRFISVCLILLAFAGCKSSTYYGAVSKNEEKFTGSKKEMARHLVDIQNEARLIKNLAVLAKENARLRTTYLVASDVETLMNDFIFDLNVFATRLRVKLPASLSSDAERDYHFIEQQVKTGKFDQFYLNESLRYLVELENRLKKYSSEGEEEPARSFSSRQLTSVNESYSQLKTAKEEMEVTGSSN